MHASTVLALHTEQHNLHTANLVEQLSVASSHNVCLLASTHKTVNAASLH